MDRPFSTALHVRRWHELTLHPAGPSRITPRTSSSEIPGSNAVIHQVAPASAYGATSLPGDSSIVLFGGRAKDRPYPGSLTVSTVNGGISGMMRAMAVQLAPRRVNAIHPGIVGDSPYWTENQEFTEKVREATPTGRNVTIADIVDAVDFLMRNRSVNGIDLYIDGGWLLQ